ncbi:EpsG family protein [Prevotellaceae bacterium MN60]|nr:EpsG family protein [Prevotellaceae bacterium MN60]
MAYAFPYILVLFIFAILALIYAQRQDSKDDEMLCTCVTWGAISVFYLFFAFRGYVYSDWLSYSESYNNVEWKDIFSLTNEKHKAVIHEPGFTALMWLCSIFTREYAFLVIVITTIDTILFIRFLKRWDVKNIPFALMLFFTFEGVGLMFNALRNQISIFIFINALEYIVKRKPIQYFSICFAALCFHASSIVYFPLYFFLGRKMNKWLFLGGILAFFAFYISQASIVLTLIKILGLEGSLGEKATFYTEYFTTARALSPTGTLEKMGLTLLIFIYYEKLTTNKANVILINSLVLCYFFYYVFGEFQELSSRMSLLFEYSYWVIWIRMIDVLAIQNNKRIFGGVFFLYCLYVTSLAYKMPIQEYDNLLLGGKNQSERIKIYNKTVEDDD